MARITDYSKIRSHLLVKIIIPEYKVNPGDTATPVALCFSDLNRDNSYEFDGFTYTGLGVLMNITASTSELRPSSGELTISVSGIPNESIWQILNSKFKGCSVFVYRVLFDATTGAQLDLVEGNPLARFRGFVNNYSLQEEYDTNSRTSSNTLLFICKSSLDVLQNKVSGRLTNPVSESKFFTNDPTFDRVPTLQNTSFNFGQGAPA